MTTFLYMELKEVKVELPEFVDHWDSTGIADEISRTPAEDLFPIIWENEGFGVLTPREINEEVTVAPPKLVKKRAERPVCLSTPARVVKKKKFTPNHKKDAAYWAHRAKNTAAAKASREKRRAAEIVLCQDYKERKVMEHAKAKFLAGVRDRPCHFCQPN